MRILIANIISFIAQMFLLYATSRKTKHDMLFFMNVFSVIVCISTSILGGYTGVILNIIGIIRNLCVMKEINNRTLNWFLILLALVLGFLFNQSGIVGILLLFAAFQENVIILNPNNSIIVLKLSSAFASFCWAAFAFYIKDYTNATFNTVNTISYLLFVFKQLKEEKQSV
ncbi:MAG: YgjV family protein [Erysipelotrichaceae bacterium]|nr:YgjV family protein [Erysipelotrichaceae bacterium]